MSFNSKQNIEPIYYSNENFELLYSTIEKFSNSKKIKLSNNYRQQLFGIMEHVENKAGLVPQKNYSTSQWLQMLNKKVLKLVTSNISHLTPKTKPKVMPRSSQMGQVNQMPIRPPQPTNQPVGPGFDSMVNRTERFDPSLPPPQMADYQSSRTQELFKEAQDRRDMSRHAMPKPSFNNKQTQDVAMTEEDANNQYEELMKLRGDVEVDTFSDKLKTFQDTNVAMNEHMASMNSLPSETKMESIIPEPMMPTQDLDDHMKGIRDMDINTRENFNIKEDFGIQKKFADRDAEMKAFFNKGLTKKEELDGSYPLIQPKEVSYIKRKQLLTVDSIDRDLELYPDSTNFRVQFNAESNSVKHVERYLNINGERRLFYAGAINEEGIRAAPVLTSFKNIHSVKLIVLSMPITNNGIYKFIDEPFLLVNIDELDNTYDGTNTVSNKTFARVNQLKNSLGGFSSRFSQQKFSQMGPFENTPRIYSPAPLATLNSMTLQIKTNRNDDYSIGNDKLDVLAVREVNTGNCMETMCDSDNILQLLVRLERAQGMNEQEMIMEAINNETVYFFCKNTCYANQWLNFDIFNSGDVEATLESGLNLKIVSTLDGVQQNIMFSSLIDTQQIMKINTGLYRYTGTVNDDNSIQLRLISGTAPGSFPETVDNIQISAIDEKGFTSRNCCDINYYKGYKILPYNTDAVNSCEGSTQDKNPQLYANTKITMKPVAGIWDTSLGTYSENFYGNVAGDCCGSNNVWEDTLTETSLFSFPGGESEWYGANTSTLNQYNLSHQNECTEKYYYQTFSMIKPKNFNIEHFELGDIFLARKRKQLSYTFEITTIEQNRQLIDTKIV